MEFFTGFVFFLLVYIFFLAFLPYQYPKIKELCFEYICLYGIVMFFIADTVSSIAILKIFGA